ncbi:MAG: ribonuclease III [Deltaproteobacteria bacterium]|nr:ribonuclease III [Deltaproteobacteria bacterium]
MKITQSLDNFTLTLPFSFTDRPLLKKVFVHRSYLNEKEGSGLESNERLEFLGDAVLSAVISHMLYIRYPEINEGILTKMRARLVNRQALASLALKLRLDNHLLLGKGEKRTGGDANPTILAGVFEAFIAAVYFHHGFQKTFEYLEAMFSPLLEATLDEPVHFDYKPRLQELAQKLFKEAPVYALTREEGLPHKKTFDVEVSVNGKALGKGTASKKKDAEQLAAGEALKNLTERYKEFFPDPAVGDAATNGT